LSASVEKSTRSDFLNFGWGSAQAPMIKIHASKAPALPDSARNVFAAPHTSLLIEPNRID
jgi:hypothetical protein